MLNEEQGERFDHHIHFMEERCQDCWDINMLSDYLRYSNEIFVPYHKQKKILKPLV